MLVTIRVGRLSLQGGRELEIINSKTSDRPQAGSCSYVWCHNNVLVLQAPTISLSQKGILTFLL